MEQDIRTPKHAAEPVAPIIPALAWGLVAFAMFLAALVVVAGIAGTIASENRPEPTVSTPTDTIYPPRVQWGDGSILLRPCNPTFQRCEVTP